MNPYEISNYTLVDFRVIVNFFDSNLLIGQKYDSFFLNF